MTRRHPGGTLRQILATQAPSEQEVSAVRQYAPATPQTPPAPSPPVLSRAGAVCALLGGVGYLALSVAHGNLPSTSGPPALRFVADRPGWPAVYLGLLACVLLWPVAFAALAGSIVREPARLLGWLAVAGALVGAAVFAVDAALNGLALKTVADDWAAAPSAGLLQLGEAMVRLAYATFSTYLMLLLGLPFVLAGLAMAASRSYPAWLGLLGAVAGAGRWWVVRPGSSACTAWCPMGCCSACSCWLGRCGWSWSASCCGAKRPRSHRWRRQPSANHPHAPPCERRITAIVRPVPPARGVADAGQ